MTSWSLVPSLVIGCSSDYTSTASWKVKRSYHEVPLAIPLRDEILTLRKINLGGGLKLCWHLLGELIQLDEHIFQIGWNHQPVIFFNLFFSNKPANWVHWFGGVWFLGFPYALWKGLVYLGTPRFEGPKPPIYRLVSQVTIRIDPNASHLEESVDHSGMPLEAENCKLSSCRDHLNGTHLGVS